METQHLFILKVLEAGRRKFHSYLQNNSDEHLCAIPKGYNNNLLWNIGHVVVTQHLLVYKLQSAELQLPEEMIESFRKGSMANAAENLQWKSLIEQELENGILELGRFLQNEKSTAVDYPTSFGVHLSSLDDCLQFLLMHEGIHLGYCMALSRSISQPAQ